MQMNSLYIDLMNKPWGFLEIILWTEQQIMEQYWNILSFEKDKKLNSFHQ